jgi:protein-tyrosine phosphatase
LGSLFLYSEKSSIMKKVLMVCLGNICRSPMAEGILRSKVGDGLEIDSAGTGGWHAGEAPDRRAQACLRGHGIDISDLRARQFTISDFDSYDHIFVMDRMNFSDVSSMARQTEDLKKLEMILERTHPGERKPVPDPYYGGDQGFENVYYLLDAACEKIANELK